MRLTTSIRNEDNIMQRIITALFGLLLLLVIGALPLYAQEPDNTAIIDAIKAQTEPTSMLDMLTPDERWHLELTRYDCTPVDVPNAEEPQPMSYEVMTLQDAAGEAEPQLIAEQVINCGGFGAFGLNVLNFSLDNRYIYYTDAREGYPDGGGFWLRPVIRLDTEDLTSENLGGGVFSRAGSLLVTWQSGQPVVTIYNTQEAEPLGTFEATDDHILMSELFWLPDSSGVIVVEANDFMATSSVMSMIDIETMEKTVILETSNTND
jgi:hypothetical protein